MPGERRIPIGWLTGLHIVAVAATYLTEEVKLLSISVSEKKRKYSNTRCGPENAITHTPFKNDETQKHTLTHRLTCVHRSIRWCEHRYVTGCSCSHFYTMCYLCVCVCVCAVFYSLLTRSFSWNIFYQPFMTLWNRTQCIVAPSYFYSLFE